MKISFFNERKQYKSSFSAGLTQSISKKIQNADPILISQKLMKKGISTNFDNNQTIAWCCNKVVEIIEYINEKFNMNLALPKGIFVDDFEKLKIGDSTTRAFCNLRPFELFKGSSEVVPSRTIFFNNFKTC